MLHKNKRIIDKKLLNIVKNKTCVSCGHFPPNDPHHIKTRGSGGHDLPHNVITLCSVCHTEVHKIGLNVFTSKYYTVYLWLQTHGWTFDEINMKWKHYEETP